MGMQMTRRGRSRGRSRGCSRGCSRGSRGARVGPEDGAAVSAVAGKPCELPSVPPLVMESAIPWVQQSAPQSALRLVVVSGCACHRCRRQGRCYSGNCRPPNTSDPQCEQGMQSHHN
jgi:hypothetical protein